MNICKTETNPEVQGHKHIRAGRLYLPEYEDMNDTKCIRICTVKDGKRILSRLSDGTFANSIGPDMLCRYRDVTDLYCLTRVENELTTVCPA